LTVEARLRSVFVALNAKGNAGDAEAGHARCPERCGAARGAR
jgi:hypothetical protein